MPTSPFSQISYEKTFQLLCPINLFSFVQITSTLVQRHGVWCCGPHQSLGQIDHDWYPHVFHGVICKPPTVLQVKSGLFATDGITIPLKVGSHNPIFASNYSLAHFFRSDNNWTCER